MHHHVVADVEAAMRDTSDIIAHRAFKEDHISGFGFVGSNGIAVPIKSCGTHMPDVVDTCAGKQP